MTETAAASDERLLTGYSGRLLLSISVGWAVIQGGRLVLSPLLPAIRADLGLSNAEAGFAFTLLWGLYALLQYPSGRLSDRLSRKTLLVTGLSLAVAGFAVLGIATNYALFLAGAAVVGLGAGPYPTSARALLSDLFVARRGQAFGLHTASGDAGGVAAAGLATVVLAVAAWRAAFLPVLFVMAAVGLSVHVWSREPYSVARVDLAVVSTLRRLLGVARMRWLLLSYFLFSFTWQATTAFLPTFLQLERGLVPSAANAGFAVLFLVGATVKPVSGWLGDRIAREAVAPAALLLSAATLVGLLVVPSTALIIAAVVVFAAGLMAFPPVMQSYLMDTFPTESMGGDLGGMRTIYIGLGALGPTAVGVVADYLSYAAAFAGLAGCLLLSAVVLVVSTRS